jgi:hypothetical protein
MFAMLADIWAAKPQAIGDNTMKQLVFPALAGLLLIAAPMPASSKSWNWKSGPSCAEAPRHKWMTFDGAKAKATELGYQPAMVLVARGCYVVYGYDSNGAKTKFSLHPVTGQIMRENRKYRTPN